MQYRRWTRAWILFCVALSLSVAGCAGATSSVRSDDKPSPESAYLYGQFRVDGGGGSIGFGVRCADGTTYTIEFMDERQVQVIKVNPSRCSLADISYLGGKVVRRADPPPYWQHAITFAPRRAYYVGDYRAIARHDAKYRVLYTEHSHAWQVTQVDGKYESTTAEMRRRFPMLAVLETLNESFAPPEKPTGPAAGRPPVTPERAARIAAHTKQQYATPAECEAACPTGKCFAFRGDAGPVMACVVHCTADKDCPRGLACNCPKNEGPDCRLIAQTPEDPMEGICLAVEPAPAPAPPSPQP